MDFRHAHNFDSGSIILDAGYQRIYHLLKRYQAESQGGVSQAVVPSANMREPASMASDVPAPASTTGEES